MHPSRLDPDQEDYQMMSLEFAGADSPFGGPVAQISCGRYVPAHWQEAINYRPLAALQVSCQHGIAFIDIPSTLVWFDEAGRHQESLDFERPGGRAAFDAVPPRGDEPSPQDHRPGRRL